MRDDGQVERLVATTVEKLGRLDVAFNNAGSGHRPAPLADLTLQDFDEAISLNLRGLLVAMKYEIAAMLACGGGAIVNMSSTAGLSGVRGMSAYCATKHAVIGGDQVGRARLRGAKHPHQRRRAGSHRHRSDRGALGGAARPDRARGPDGSHRARGGSCCGRGVALFRWRRLRHRRRGDDRRGPTCRRRLTTASKAVGELANVSVEPIRRPCCANRRVLIVVDGGAHLLAGRRAPLTSREGLVSGRRPARACFDLGGGRARRGR